MTEVDTARRVYNCCMDMQYDITHGKPWSTRSQQHLLYAWNKCLPEHRMPLDKRDAIQAVTVEAAVKYITAYALQRLAVVPRVVLCAEPVQVDIARVQEYLVSVRPDIKIRQVADGVFETYVI